MNGPGAAHAPALLLVLFLGLVVWRFYLRLRRSAGRQPLTGAWPWAAVFLPPPLLAALAWLMSADPLGLATLFGGAVAGGALAVYGLRQTRFEVTARGLFYIPRTHFGLGLSLLLVLCVLYRLIEVGPALLTGHLAQMRALMLPPLTLLCLGALLGYHPFHAIGLLRRRAGAGRAGARVRASS